MGTLLSSFIPFLITNYPVWNFRAQEIFIISKILKKLNQKCFIFLLKLVLNKAVFGFRCLFKPLSIGNEGIFHFHGFIFPPEAIISSPGVPKGPLNVFFVIRNPCYKNCTFTFIFQLLGFEASALFDGVYSVSLSKKYL